MTKIMDTDKWIKQIDETIDEFVKSFSSLNQEQLNWKPNQQIWSIAQNIDHLIVINETYYPIINSIRTGTYKLPFIAKIPFIVSFLGDFILKSVQPDRRRKMKTFPIWEPSESEILFNIFEKFVSHQTELKKVINSSVDLIEKKTIVSSPANKNIVYKLETAFDIIVIHEQRHLEQARELLKIIPK